MTTVNDLVERNQTYAAQAWTPGQTINPGGNVMVIGCVDPRVDPAYVLGLRPDEAAVIRNVGGRITPATLKTLTMLGFVGQANHESRRSGDWNLVVLHHTDCGMTDLVARPDLLAEYFEIDPDRLGDKAPADPVRSVQVDVGVLTGTLTGSAFFVSGLVYDVDAGTVAVVVPPTPLRTP